MTGADCSDDGPRVASEVEHLELRSTGDHVEIIVILSYIILPVLHGPAPLGVSQGPVCARVGVSDWSKPVSDK